MESYISVSHQRHAIFFLILNGVMNTLNGVIKGAITMAVDNNVFVTKHAMDKYRKFTSYTGPIGNTLTQLIYMINGAEDFEPDAEYRVKSLIRHNFRPTRYLLAKGYVMVIVNENLATIFKYKQGDKQMWRAY